MARGDHGRQVGREPKDDTEHQLLEKLHNIQARAKQREQDIQEQIKGLKRRNAKVVELKKWMVRHKVTPKDLLWMYWKMKPERAAEPVKSKKPLKPNGKLHPDVQAMRKNPFGAKRPPVGDPELMAAFRAKRLELGWSIGEAAEKASVSKASVQNWEVGRFIPSNKGRLKLLKVYGLPLDLGEAASLEMERRTGPKRSSPSSS